MSLNKRLSATPRDNDCPVQDPFDILGVPASFDLEDDQIELAYLKRAARAHPDAAPGQSEHAMAALNDAYEAIKDPEARANCLLARLDGPSKEDETSLPDGFLMEMMETRESLEAAGQTGDTDAVIRGLAGAREQRDTFIASVAQMFVALTHSPSPESLSAIRTQLNAWRYVERLIDQVGESADSDR